jgi:two-component system, OmpR family, response regulator
MSAFEQQQIDRLEGQLADLSVDFYNAESDEQRRLVADRYEVVFRQLEEAPSWCGEPMLDSQLPDEWMPERSESAASPALEHVGYTSKLQTADATVIPAVGNLLSTTVKFGPSTKVVFTTREAAKICKVSQQTVIRCFDSGQLKGFRVPGSRFRRIPRDQLYAFMRDNGIPTDILDSGRRKLLIVEDDVETVDLLIDHFERDGRFEVRSVNNGFGAGMQIKEFRPHLVVLDVMLPDINGMEVSQLIRSDKTMDDVKILCISGMVEERQIEKLRLAGADDFIKKPFDADTLMRRICQLLDVETALAE